MVFVDGLCVVHAAVEAGEVVLGYTYERLHDKQGVGDKSHDGVRRDEMPVAAIGDFVVLDDHQAGEQGEDAGEV